MNYIEEAKKLGYKGADFQLEEIGMAIERGIIEWEHNRKGTLQGCIEAYAEGAAIDLGIE